MYCWVIVEAPCRLRPRAISYSERTIPVGDIPLSVQKLRFSAATTASLIDCGISEYAIDVRFCSAKEPRTVVPSL